MKLLYAKPRRKYSVERLRCLYVNLLQCIDIDSEDLCPRGVEESPNGRNYFSSFFSLPRRYTRQRSSSNCEGDEDDRTVLKKQELAAAFRLIAALRSAENEVGQSGEAFAPLRSEATVQAQKLARKLEATVVKIIREIGEVVVNAERPTENASLRDDDTFAYFCEKAILVMLVEIMKDKPGATTEKNSCFHGVVWSSKVKAQVLHTVSLLVSGVRDTSALHYILSQHCINEMLLSMLPLTQWTDPALEDMLSVYADLLKTLSLQLGGSPELFPFFTFQSDPKTVASFPLFSAIIQITTSSHAQSDSYVHATCLNLIVGLMRISHDPVRSWICQAEREQRHLCIHVCSRLTELYRRIANLTTGPVVDAVRSNSIGGQLAALDGQMDAVNDLFWCNINVLSVRLCETLLQQFIRVLLRDLLPGKNRKFLVVGVSDRDVIPDREAAAQAASLVLSRMFLKMEYGPFVRMLAVALFHPNSSTVWESGDVSDGGKEYVLMPALNALVQDENVDTITNVYREEILKSLTGDYGEWRVVSSAALLENAIYAVENETLVKLEILPDVFGKRQSTESALEGALASFLSRKHSCKSAMSTMSLECVSSLAVHYIYEASMSLTNDGNELGRLGNFLGESSLVSALRSAKLFFYEKTLESQHAIQVKDIVVDLVDSIVKARYKRVSTNSQGIRNQHLFVFQLSQHGSNVHCSGPEPLTRKTRGVDLNEVEAIRFYARMAIHFRAVCRVFDRFHAKLLQSAGTMNCEVPTKPPGLDLVDEAGELSSMFGCLLVKPPIGTDLDLHGRMAFGFSVQVSDSVANANSQLEQRNDDNPRMRTFSDDMIFRESSDLILVLDPTDLFVVKPFARKEVKRGTILCCIPLLDVVAAAADESRLHVAVRHDNVGFLIKNGNMVLTFESAGTCLIVCRYLDRCRNLLRDELYGKIEKLFSAEATANGGSSLLDSEAKGEIPHVKTF